MKPISKCLFITILTRFYIRKIQQKTLLPTVCPLNILLIDNLHMYYFILKQEMQIRKSAVKQKLNVIMTLFLNNFVGIDLWFVIVGKTAKLLIIHRLLMNGVNILKELLNVKKMSQSKRKQAGNYFFNVVLTILVIKKSKDGAQLPLGD